ncbi:MAG: acyl-CoA dehydrogenase family protein [Dehalococcoidia bacterium]|jgi:alkylation response protein AidB-like acyl-CoA dehydrogenase
MNLGLNEEQQMLKKSARDFLSKECPKKLVRELDASDEGFSRGLWNKMMELGWIGLAVPEKYGGGGGSFLDLVVLLEEMGYNITPGPFFSNVVLAGYTLLEGANEEQKELFLKRICSGESIITLALTELDGTYGPETINTTANKLGDVYVINGTKLFVPDAQIVDYMIVVCRTDRDKKFSEGISLFLVDAHSKGIKCTRLDTIARDKLYEVVFDNVAISHNDIIGALNEGWPIMESVLKKAAVAKCAEMVGGAQASLEMAVNYAKERVQFRHPIGSFQAIQHYCANMVTDVDGSRYITYRASWALSENQPADIEVSMAKAWTSDAYNRVTATAHQIFGAIGFTMDHDMHLYYRRAKAAEMAYGDADYHRQVVARQMGL